MSILSKTHINPRATGTPAAGVVLFFISAFFFFAPIQIFASTIITSGGALPGQATTENPTGQSGWTCTTSMRINPIGVGAGAVGTKTRFYTCRNDADANRLFAQSCTYALADDPNENGVAADCSVCESSDGSLDSNTDCRVTQHTTGVQMGWFDSTVTTEHIVYDDQGNEVDRYTTEYTPDDWLANLTLGFVAWLINFMTVAIAAALTGLLAIISLVFDMVVIEFVIEMGKYISSTSAEAVRTAWTMVRDLANIGILGGLIATAIGTIIGSEKYSIQKTLARLLIAALLVNFSYFFAGAVIDASNFLAKAAYESVVYVPNGKDGCTDPEGCGPASQFLSATAVQEWLAVTESGTNDITRGEAQESLAGEEDNGGKAYSATQGIIFNIMSIIFICVTSFVLLSAISLLVARFVVLIFLLITSPIGIAGSAIPILDKYAKEWWDALWTQTMFAPVYFLLMGISLKMLTAFKGSLLLVQNENVNTIGVVAMFTVAAGFMWAALQVAQSMSKEAKRFESLYKGAEAGLGWMPKMYAGMVTGAAKTSAAIAYRQTIGAAGERIGLAYADWAGKNQVADKGFPVPFTNGKMRVGKGMFADPLDRAIQGQLDKMRDAKIFKKDNFDEQRKKRDARQNELDDLKKNQDNEEKAEGIGAEKKLAERKKELEEKAKKGPLSKDDKEELEAINRYGERLKNEGAWAARLEALKKKKKKEALTDAEKKELDEVKRNLDDLRRLKGKFGIGGAIAKHKSAQERHMEAYKDGTERERVNEVAERDRIRAKVAAGAVELSPEDEAKLATLSTERADHLARGEDISTWGKNAEYERLRAGITSGEKEALADFEERSKPLSAAEEADLAARQDRIKKGTAKPEDHAVAAALGRRKAGLKSDAYENDGLFRQRQMTRADGKGKRYTLTYEDAPDGMGGTMKKPKWVEEKDDEYFERLDLDNDPVTGIGARAARTEGEEIAANFTKGHWERKYRKNHESIIQYAALLPKTTLLGIAQNHNIREHVRDAMLTAVGKPWTQMIIDLEDRVKTGQLVRGSPEYNAAKLVPYNYQSNNLKDHALVAEMLLSDASAGVSTLDENGQPLGVNSDGTPKTRNIRMRDMWGEDYRASLWQSSLSGTFKHFKDNKILGDTAMRDARSAKGIPFDVGRDEWTGAASLEGYEGNQEFTPKIGNTVQLDSLDRRDKAVAKKIKGTQAVIDNYISDIANNGTSTISEKAYRDAAEENRWARMLQGGEANSPLGAIVTSARNVAAMDPARRSEITAKIAKIKDIPESQVTDDERATFNQGQVLVEARQNYEQKLQSGAFGPDPANPDITQMSDAEFYWHKKAQLEEDMRGNYKGKTPEEIQSIFNRRSWNSPAMSIGIQADQLVAGVQPHDPQERTAILENILKFGDEKLIRDLATNQQLRQHFDWPDPKRLKELAVIRASVGGTELPIKSILGI